MSKYEEDGDSATEPGLNALNQWRDQHGWNAEAWDDVSGCPLDAAFVKKARQTGI